MTQKTERLQALIERLELQWESGSTPNISEFVSKFGPLSPTELAHVLLIDQAYRRSSGTPNNAAFYFEQFPELLNCAESAIDLLYAEFLQREERDPELTADQFIQAFPQFKEEFCRQVSFHRSLLLGSTQTTQDSWPVAQPTQVQNSHVVIPGYEILSELGRGGLGVVYLARDVRLNRYVALKMLLADRFASETIPKRLWLEAEATARLQHPNIVQIYEVDQYAGHPFLALEYISGGTLAAWMERRPQDPRDAAQIIRDVARAIQFAHERGVIHRDLKPSNLLLQPLSSACGNIDKPRPLDPAPAIASPSARLRLNEMLIKVADFGLAKLMEVGTAADAAPVTLTGDLIGTIAYMSPEQASAGRTSSETPSNSLTVATDIYSLGAILYELLTGRPPFVGVQPLEVLAQVVNDEPIPPSKLVRPIAKDLQTICLKCLEKNPKRRYATAAALADDLDRYLIGQPIVGRRVSRLERVRRWCWRNPIKTAAASLVTGLLIMIAAVSMLYLTMLSNQLAQTTQSQMVEKSLKTEALQLVWESSLSQADALRLSHLEGQRFESLKAIDAARALASSLDFTQSQVDRMRNATIAALALPDVRVDELQPEKWPTTGLLESMDDSLTIGAYLSSSGDAVVQRMNDGLELARIAGCSPTSRLKLSSDGSKLAIVNKQCRIYDVSTQACPLLFETSAGGVWAFSHDGQKVVGTTHQGELQLVELSRPNSIQTMGWFANATQIALSPDSKAIAMRRDDLIEVVECASGTLLFRVPAPPAREYQSFAWHPSSKVLAFRSSKDGIELWDVAGYRICHLPIGGPARFCFDREGGRLLAYRIWMERLELWNIYNREMEFSQSGRKYDWLANDPGNGFKLLENVGDGKLVRVSVTCPSVYQVLPSLHSDFEIDSIEDLTYSPDGNLLAYARYGQLDIFDSRNMTRLLRESLPGSYVQFAADGSLLASTEFKVDQQGSWRGLTRWPRTVKRQSRSLTEIVFEPAETICEPMAEIANAPLAVAISHPLVAIPRYDGVQLSSLSTNERIQSQSTHADVRRVSISPDGKRVATAGWNSGNVCIWSTDTGQLQHTIHESSTCTVQYSPDGQQLAIAADDIKVLDAQTWQLQYRFTVSGRPNAGVSICFSPDGRTLAVSDSNGRIHLVDAKRGTEFLELSGPSFSRIYRLIYSPDGSQLAVLSASNMAGIWHLNRLQAELRDRELGWTEREQADSFMPRSDAIGETNRPSLSDARSMISSEDRFDVKIVLDERFRQLEAGAMIRQALSSVEEFRFDAAKLSIARALELRPQDPAHCNNLAWLLATGPMDVRDPEAAVQLAEIAARDEGANGQSLYTNTLGVAQFRAGLFHEALATLKKSLAVQSPNWQAFDLYFLAMCSVELEDQEAAREYFKQAEELKERYRADMAFDSQAELNKFHREAEAMLRPIL